MESHIRAKAALQSIQVSARLGELHLTTDRPDRPREGAAPAAGERYVDSPPIGPRSARDQRAPPKPAQQVAGRGLIHTEIGAEIGQGHVHGAVGSER